MYILWGYYTSFSGVCQAILRHFMVYFLYMVAVEIKTAKAIGNNLKEARKFKGFTQKEVGQKMRMTQQQYSRFENGVFELNYDQILFLCELLDITPNELFNLR